MTIDLLVHSASQVLQLTGEAQRGHQLGELNLLEDGAVAVEKGVILEVGSTRELRGRHKARRELDAGGRVVLPGFVDPHTHLVWAGDRAEEFERRVSGATYMEIMAAGGGIQSTVELTRRSSQQDLVEESRPRLHRMLAHGTTTAEAKTGYGLEIEAELRLLASILQLDKESEVDLVPTFLGGHAVPQEYKTRYEGSAALQYTDHLVEDMLPAVHAWWSRQAGDRALPFVDVFCETGVFDLSQSRRILERAIELGFPVKIHSDEFDALGGTRLAVELGAASADHLVHSSSADIEALGTSETVAVALPCTPFGLGEKEYTPAHRFLDAGAILALATDLNPGTAWCESMQFVIALACRAMQLTPGQSIAASTINAAAALRRSETIGSLHPGKRADFILLETADYRHLGYRFGTNLVVCVVKDGEVVVGG